MGNLAQIVSAAQENGRRIDMERYSDVAADILNDLHTERLAYNSEYVPLMDAINRLAEYEDTGLEPEEIKEAIEKAGKERLTEMLMRSRLAQFWSKILCLLNMSNSAPPPASANWPRQTRRALHPVLSAGSIPRQAVMVNRAVCARPKL